MAVFAVAGGEAMGWEKNGDFHPARACQNPSDISTLLHSPKTAIFINQKEIKTTYFGIIGND
ncbi:hypothetical protein [Allofranklinella schreckenbergeri]|uniref:hypothetical protein n=1 Tax=Allofranklinella schreckenbergeri TaxID=1076744 RepID=UPI0011C48295|nr:hypothetical protein [Allofranklinella schreckenbergeri]